MSEILLADFKMLNREKQDDQLTLIVEQALSTNETSSKPHLFLQELLGFDEVNLKYFLGLYKKKKDGENSRNESARTKKFRIFDEGIVNNNKDPNFETVFPTAIARPEHLQNLPIVELSELLGDSSSYLRNAAEASVIYMKLQAGTGSSVERSNYLAKELGIPEAEVKTGSKGTDLFVNIPNPLNINEKIRVSLAEAQIIQAMHQARSGIYSKVLWKDIVSNETEAAVDKIWNKPSAFGGRKSYLEQWKEMETLGHDGKALQCHIPTIGENGFVTLARMAPGGHALFGLFAIMQALEVPKTKNSVAIIGNGEDLSSSPPPEIIGMMLGKKVPIVMLTTDKTPIDMKGGQLAILRETNGKNSVTILEKAQAEAADQVDLFESMGLRQGDGKAYFNTNMSLYNFDILHNKLNALKEKIGEEDFFKEIMPDLIINTKKQQAPSSGVEKSFLQLEGAKGSTLLNLNRIYETHFGEPLVHFVNLSKEQRTMGFSPVKTAMDYFVQFESNLFSISPDVKLVDHRPGRPLNACLEGPSNQPKYFNDISNVRNTFAGSHFLEIENLNVSGRIGLSEITLQGKVIIESQLLESRQLVDLLKRLSIDTRTFKNQKIIVDRNGEVSVYDL